MTRQAERLPQPTPAATCQQRSTMTPVELLAQADALGHRTTTVYNDAGTPIAMINANGGRNTYTHDSVGRTVQQLDALGRATTISYDAAGRQRFVLDARGIRTTFQYDATARITLLTSTNDPAVTFSYDTLGNRTEIEDVTGRSTFTSRRPRPQIHRHRSGREQHHLQLRCSGKQV